VVSSLLDACSVTLTAVGPHVVSLIYRKYFLKGLLNDEKLKFYYMFIRFRQDLDFFVKIHNAALVH